DDELTVISPEFMAPNNVQEEIGFRSIRIATEINFTEAGIIASLTDPLQNAGIAVRAVSTFNTIYIFFREELLAEVMKVLQEAGHEFIAEE
ncbi:MAG: ACT domain-containing protein, partial [Bacteroidota bacterium]